MDEEQKLGTAENQKPSTDERESGGSYERTVIVRKKKESNRGEDRSGGVGSWTNHGKRRSVGKYVLIWLGVALLMFFLAFLVWDGRDSDGLPAGPYIGTLYIEGEISSATSDSFGYLLSYQHQWTLDQIDSMMDDDDNKGILLFLDTPGGGVYESDELYLKLLQYKEETDRPVYAAMGSMAASGGYYIAAAADQIYANRNTLTGSIGVTLGTQFDISGFLERYGIKAQTLTSGRNKAMGDMTKPMTEEQKAIYQSIIDDSYQQFVEVVAEGRGMSADQVKPLADGRIYTARQALSCGLIDVIGTPQDAAYDMMEEYGLWDCDVEDITYEETSIWDRILSVSSGRGFRINGDAAALLEYVKGQGHFPVSYLCETLR